MNFKSVESFMGQQLSKLEELETLLQHDADQDAPGHSVSSEDIQKLRMYVDSMKTAVNTAIALTKHYAAETKPEPKEDKPKKRRTKKQKPEENDDDLDFLT